MREVAPHLKPLAGPVLAFAGSAGVGTLKFVLSIVLSGFLFIYGPRLVEAIRRIQARLVTQRSEDFVALAGLTIRTVSQGVIGVAVLQSLLAGIGLKLAGVPHAGVLAFAVLVLAILQIGSAIVLFPVIIWIWATKDFAVALPMTIYLVIVGLADNILKPILMGRGLSTPMLVIFIGVLGGMIAHGIVGLFVGPIILAVAWELMMAWIREERAEAAAPDPAQGAEKVGVEVAAEVRVQALSSACCRANPADATTRQANVRLPLTYVNGPLGSHAILTMGCKRERFEHVYRQAGDIGRRAARSFCIRLRISGGYRDNAASCSSMSCASAAFNTASTWPKPHLMSSIMPSI